MATRVVLSDADQLTRARLRVVLGAYNCLEIVGEADSGAATLASALRLQPDVVLADMSLPDLDGLQLTNSLECQNAQRGGARTAVLLVVSSVSRAVIAALRAGADGALLKNSSPEEYVSAIQVAAAGESLLYPRAARHLLDDLRLPDEPAAPGARAGQLTGREREVISLLAEGLSNLEIARRLHLAESTVKYHVSQLLRKLDLRDRLQAAALAHRCGWRATVSG